MARAFAKINRPGLRGGHQGDARFVVDHFFQIVRTPRTGAHPGQVLQSHIVVAALAQAFQKLPSRFRSADGNGRRDQPTQGDAHENEP